MIEITREPRNEAGSCNACHGNLPEVSVIHLRTLSFRLCDPCRAELIRELWPKGVAALDASRAERTNIGLGKPFWTPGVRELQDHALKVLEEPKCH
jgi:hypothetical protein